MTTFDIDFNWPIYNKGYQVLPAEPETKTGHVRTRKAERIVQIGKKHRWESPLLIHNLYLQFATLEKTPDACVSFANKYGFLFHDEQSIADGEPLKDWYRQITVMKGAVGVAHRGELLERWSTLQDMKFTSIDVVLRPDQTNVAKLHLEPPTLLSAIHLQFAQALTSGAETAVCEHCKMWFQRGGPGGRQRSAKTCSRKCHVALNNSKRGTKGESK